MNKKIGKVTLGYSEKGNVLFATFEPEEFNTSLPSEYGEDLVSIQQSTPEAIKKSADGVMQSWFNTVNEIEMADMMHNRIDSDVVDCQKYPNGSVKQCVIQYTLTSL